MTISFSYEIFRGKRLIFNTRILTQYSGTVPPDVCEHYARGQISSINQRLEPFKFKIILVYLVSQIFWHSIYIMIVPHGVNPIFPRQNAKPQCLSVPLPPGCSHVTWVLLIRCIYRAVDTEVIYMRKQVGCRASILQAQMAEEAVWFWKCQEQRFPSQLVLLGGLGDCFRKLTPCHLLSSSKDYKHFNTF